MIEKWTQEEIEAIRETIPHWERMKKWAEEQDPGERISSSIMQSELGECWEGRYCPLCISHWESCEECPLEIAGFGCNLGECSPWRKVNSSKNWGKFVKNADNMIAALKALLVPEVE